VPPVPVVSDAVQPPGMLQVSTVAPNAYWM
jgi:hypothetical protein